MADNFGSFYSGNMAPPLRLPDGSYIPAPASGPSMSVPQMYDGIYGGGSPGLASVSRPTVPINPNTGMPYATSASARVAGAGGIGAGGSGQVRYSPPVYQPNGTTVANKDQSRLPVIPAGLPLASPLASARPGLGAIARANGAITAMVPTPPQQSSGEVIRLSFEPMSEVSGQNFANSSGKPVSGPSGKVYYPSNAPQSGVRAPMRPVAASAQAPAPQRTSGGWLSSLFGGNGGGLLGGGAPRVQAVPQPSSGPAIYTPSGAVHPGSFYDNSGNDMAFMPQSYQDNPRNSNGGY